MDRTLIPLCSGLLKSSFLWKSLFNNGPSVILSHMMTKTNRSGYMIEWLLVPWSIVCRRHLSCRRQPMVLLTYALPHNSLNIRSSDEQNNSLVTKFWFIYLKLKKLYTLTARPFTLTLIIEIFFLKYDKAQELNSSSIFLAQSE